MNINNNNNNEFLCNGKIMLEPRLQEYIKKKKFYKNNNIVSGTNIEKEFNISNDDIKMIKKFMKGDKNIYNNYQKKLKNKNNKNKRKQFFPSKKFRDDPKFKKLNKNQKLKYQQNNSYYLNNIQDIEFDENDFNENKFNNSNCSNNNNNNFNYDNFSHNDHLNNDYYMDNLKSINSNDNYTELGKFYESSNLNVKNPTNHKKNDKCNNKMFEYNMMKNINTKLDGKINSLMDQYNPRSDPIMFNSNLNKCNNKYAINDCNKKNLKHSVHKCLKNKNKLDRNNRLVIPNLSNKKKINEDINYTSMPHFNYEDEKYNTEIENELIKGIPTHTDKSYGYRNPEEHYFEFIENDFQNPENTIEPWTRGGINTRMNNKKKLKQYN